MADGSVEQTYVYEPLKSGYFRVVEFLPPLDGLVIRCRLSVYPVNDTADAVLEYDALSYTWGDHEKSEAIEIDGKLLPITWSLYYALYHLRSRHTRIWIDAICINQGDKEEKERQVQEMGKIYQQAAKVVIWLGDATLATDRIMNDLGLLEAECHATGEEWEFNDPRWQSSWNVLQAERKSVEGQTSIQLKFGLKVLMARQWFTRIWIIQEVAFARAAVVHCGGKSISGKVFSLAPSLLGVQVGKLRQAIFDIMPGVPREQSWWHESRDLLSLMQRFSHSQASEARDRIYALMNMCSDERVTQYIVPNYRNTDVEVVQETLRYLFGFEYSMLDFTPDDVRRIIESCPTVSTFVENLERIKAEALVMYGMDDMARGVDEICSMIEDRGNSASGALRFCLQHANVRPEPLSPRTVEACASYQFGGYGLVQVLLDLRGSEVKVTENVVTAAVKNDQQGTEVVRLLLDRRDCEVVVTEGILTAAASNLYQGNEIIQLLLDRRGCEVVVTEGILTAAVRNSDQGHEIMQLLLDRRGREVVVTERILTAAASNSSQGYRIIQLLLYRRGREVVVTERILTAAAGNLRQGDLITQLLLHRRGREVVITERTLTAAASNSSQGHRIMQLLLERWVREVVVTERVLMAAAGNELYGKKIIQRLLDRRGSEVVITEDILTAAAGNNSQGYKVIELLLRRDSEVVVTEGVLTAAAGNNSQGYKIIQLLHDRGSEVVMTENIIRIATDEHGRDSRLVELLCVWRDDDRRMT